MKSFTFPTPESPIARNFKSSELSTERDAFTKVVIECYSTNVDVMCACFLLDLCIKKKETKENDNIDEGGKKLFLLFIPSFFL